MTTQLNPRGLEELVQQSNVPVVVADASLPDAPLTIINAAFSEMTGYSSSEMIGKNCRFLQPTTGAGPVTQRIRGFLADDTQEQSQFIIPNARKDGTRFLNLLLLTKLMHPNRAPLIIGSQFDVTSRSSRELSAYNASLRYDMRLIEKLVKTAGRRMPPPDEALADSLERISELEF